MNKCWKCLFDAEKLVESGKWKEAEVPLKYWYEMFDAESNFIKKLLSKNKPKLVLEIGTGAGRIIELILKNSETKIVSFEKDPEIYRLTKKRFLNNERNQLVLNEIEIPRDKKFDYVFLMMNTVGNQTDEKDILRLAFSFSNKVIFTVYKRGTENIRWDIYKKRDHEKFILKDSCFIFYDEWCKGLISKAYSKDDIMNICKDLNCKVNVTDLCKMAYIVELEKE